MEQSVNSTNVTFGLLTRLFIWLTGADIPTLQSCPERDVDNIRALGCLMLGVWLYQSLLFATIAQVMLAPSGGLRPEFIAAAVLVATLIMLIDSYMIMRSGWHLHGINELKRGGLDISGGLGARIKNGVFLTLRIFLAAVLAQLTAIFLALLLFQADITAEIDRTYQQRNARLFTDQATLVDARLHQAADLMEKTGSRITALETELASIRLTLIDARIDGTQVQDAADRVRRLETEKTAADTALADAVTFASNELAGIKGAAGNTGKVGSGPVRSAAEEKVRFATGRQADVAEKLKQAQSDLAAARADNETGAQEKRRQAGTRLGEVTAELAAARSRLAEQKSEYEARAGNREGDIRAGVENDPRQIAVNSGFLAHLTALKRIASDLETQAVIILIDIASFGIELAAVLAKVTSFIPSSYATLLAREAIIGSVRAAQETAREMERATAEPARNEPPPAPAGNVGSDIIIPPRKRGRPRKQTGMGIVPHPSPKFGNGNGNDNQPGQDQPQV